MCVLVRVSNSVFEKCMDEYLNLSNWPEIPKHSEKTQQNSNYQRVFFFLWGEMFMNVLLCIELLVFMNSMSDFPEVCK